MLRRLVITCLALTILGIMASPGHAGTEARMKGTVVNAAGEPIPEATIRITTDEIQSFDKQVDVKKDGSFSTVLLDATKQYIFHVEAPGYALHEERFKVNAGSTDNVFRFELKTSAQVAEQERDQVFDQPGFRELKQAAALLAEGNDTGALAALEAAVAAKPDLVMGWIGLAELTYGSGDMSAALGHAERCLALDDEEVRCLAVAANACRDLGHMDRHETYFARYQELNPNDPAAIFNRAVGFLNAYDDAAARPLLEECIAADDTFPNCHFEYGMVLLRESDMPGAKAQLERYLELAPEGPDAATARETLKYLQ